MEDQLKHYTRMHGEITARAMADPAYRSELLADPRGVLAAAGIDVPADVRIEVVTVAPDVVPTSAEIEQPKVVYFVLNDPDDELSAEDLQAVAGGNEASTWSSIWISTILSSISSLSANGA
jgi:hypothetical protein